MATQWGLGRIRAEPAWRRISEINGKVTAPGEGQTVGVVDGGIDQSHPAFCKGPAACRKTVTEEFLDGRDRQETGTRISYGTAVAGVIVGRSANAHGVAWGIARLGTWRLNVGAEFGMAHAAVQDGVISGLSPLFSSAFALRADRPLDAGSLQFSISQPLCIESGRARLSVPVGRTKDRRVLRRSLTADLAPTGRQIDAAVRWQRSLTTGGELRLGATWTLDPGHDDAAPSDLTIMAGWRHSF